MQAMLRAVSRQTRLAAAACLAAVTGLAGAALLLTAKPAAADDGCRLCFSTPAAAPGETPLTIEIWADLNFSKLALTGSAGGSAAVDPAT